MIKKVFNLYPENIKRLTIYLFALTALIAVFTVVTLPYIPMSSFLLWNMFLGGVPLVFATIMLLLEQKKGKAVRVTMVFLGLCWLFFYPNAPYMITDLIHLNKYNFYLRGYGFLQGNLAWLSLVGLVLAIVTGCTFGNISFFLVHKMVVRKSNRVVGWLFVLITSVLSGIAIYIGRFMRFNSWEVVTSPFRLVTQIVESLSAETLAHYAIFSVMVFTTYLLFYFMVNTPATISKESSKT